MKQIIINILTALSLILAATTTFAQTAHTSRIDLGCNYEGSHIQRKLCEEVRVFVKISDMQIVRKQDLLVVTPSIADKQGHRIELTPCVISGKTRFKIIQRRRKLGEALPEYCSKGKIRQLEEPSQTIELHYTASYEPWMQNASLQIEERLYGCADCGTRTACAYAGRSDIEAFRPSDHPFQFIEAPSVNNKVYTEDFSCRVQFRQDKHYLDSNYKDNRQELDGLNNFINDMLKIKGSEIKTVDIRGYASPEGSFAHNKKLSEKRAMVLAEYSRRHHPAISQVMEYDSCGCGEDWDGLLTMLVNDEYRYAEEVDIIMEDYTSDIQREEAIKKIENGKVYQHIYQKYFPALRRTEFTVTMNVRPYNDQEIREAYASRPGTLSQQEMYKLAMMWIKEGRKPTEIFRTAYKLFPGDKIAILNYANALMKYEEQPEEALEILKEIKDEKEYRLPAATALHMAGRWQEAEETINFN